MHEADKTTRAIAALLHLTTIGIEDAITEIDPGLARRLDKQDLVATDPEIAVRQIADLFRRQRHRLTHAVKDDEVVAETMHLGELEFHKSPRKLNSKRITEAASRHALSPTALFP